MPGCQIVALRFSKFWWGIHTHGYNHTYIFTYKDAVYTRREVFYITIKHYCSFKEEIKYIVKYIVEYIVENCKTEILSHLQEESQLITFNEILLQIFFK